jgi:hypothetical protein
MVESEQKGFYALLAGVYGFYRVDLTPFALTVWWEACKPFDAAAVKDALNRHCVNPDNGQFLPKPADVVKLLSGSTKDAAYLGWSKVQNAMLSVGAYETVCFDDPIINQVVHDLGGWPYLCGLKQDETPFKANEFVTRYQGIRTRGGLQQWPQKLTGIADMGNAANGFGGGDVRLIGDARAAQKVLAGGANEHAIGVVREMLQIA